MTEEIETTLSTIASDGYKTEALLYHSDKGMTYLLYSETLKRKCILKIRKHPDAGRIKNDEAATLKELEKYGITAPRLIKTGEIQGYTYLIREYIEGQTLENYAGKKGNFSEGELLGIGIKLINIIKELHSVNPPIIHRDIKPGNIIVVKGTEDIQDVKLVLIDYDTARVYKDDATSDTMLMGTKQTAAPEQFGFAQSDVRTDIYGFGKTMIYLACNAYDERKLAYTSYSKKLIKLMISCVSLDKKDRPASADTLHKELTNLYEKWTHTRMHGGTFFRRLFLNKHSKVSIICFMAALVLISAGAVCIGYNIGISVDKNAGTPEQNQVHAASPAAIDATTRADTAIRTDTTKEITSKLHKPDEEVDFGGSESMETAVRTALSMNKGSVTYKDLSKIKSLYAIGNMSSDKATSYRYLDTYDNLLTDPEHDTHTTIDPLDGDIEDLSLLSYMTSLKKCYLAHQNFSDITPILDLPITELAIVDSPVDDLSGIDALTHLKELTIGRLPIENLDPIKGLKQLNFLTLNELDIESLAPVPKEHMTFLTLDDVQLDKPDMDTISEMKLLDILEVGNMDEEYLYKIGNLPTITDLRIRSIPLTSGFTKFGRMDNLEHIYLASSVDSVEGLDRYPLLKTIQCNSHVWRMIKDAYPDATYKREKN
ncbi:MAG: protein kinase [Eubacterium sp.]|nr:protein kinase [Eubacterium sp.]